MSISIDPQRANLWFIAKRIQLAHCWTSSTTKKSAYLVHVLYIYMWTWQECTYLCLWMIWLNDVNCVVCSRCKCLIYGFCSQVARHECSRAKDHWSHSAMLNGRNAMHLYVYILHKWLCVLVYLWAMWTSCTHTYVILLIRRQVWITLYVGSWIFIFLK